MRNNISPYPPNVRIKNIADGAQVFVDEKYVGDVNRVQNWGSDWKAKGKFFTTKTAAVKHLIGNS